MGEGYEIDFLDAGDGYAISVRYSRSGAYRVMIYDVTSEAAGTHLVDHIRLHYETSRVDCAVCVRSDVGRAAGLAVVLENLGVDRLWMHRPWEYSDDVFHYLLDPLMAAARPCERVKKEMDAVFRLYELAVLKGVRMLEPFQGAQIGAFHVMSPDRKWYVVSLLPDAVRPADGAATVDEDGRTSPGNESSVVLLGEIAGRKILLTGNAGVRALTATAMYAERFGISLPHALKFIQIPYHGHRDNISPGVLDRLIGPRIERSAVNSLTAFVSTADASGTFPHTAVVNAFLERGAAVAAMNRRSLRHYFRMPARQGWRTVESLPFVQEADVSAFD